MQIDRVVTALKSDTNISAQVTGVFVSDVPRGVDYPLIVITPVSVEVMNTLEGEVQNLDRFTVQIDVWSKTYSSAMNLMMDAKYAMGAATTFTAIVSANRYDHDLNNSLHRFSIDFSIWH